MFTLFKSVYRKSLNDYIVPSRSLSSIETQRFSTLDYPAQNLLKLLLPALHSRVNALPQSELPGRSQKSEQPNLFQMRRGKSEQPNLFQMRRGKSEQPNLFQMRRGKSDATKKSRL
jgi:hypothetical protein